MQIIVDKLVTAYKTYKSYVDIDINSEESKELDNESTHKSQKSYPSTKSKQSSKTEKISKRSKNAVKSKRRSTTNKSEKVVNSKKSNGDVLDKLEVETKREKTLIILENQETGNPFKNSEDNNSENMYYPSERKDSSTHSLNNSLRSKKDKAKISFPKIQSNRGSSLNSSHQDLDNENTLKLTHEQRDLLNKSRTQQQNQMSAHRQMASYDLKATRSIDREIKKGKIEGPNNADTIMTMDEAVYSAHRLESYKGMHDTNNMTNFAKYKHNKAPSQDLKIRVSTSCSRKDASLAYQAAMAEDIEEFPDINNSVVEDSLPFQGLDKSNAHNVSLEGFSGSRMTYYNNLNNAKESNAYRLPGLRDKNDESTIYFKEHSSTSLDERRPYGEQMRQPTPESHNEMRHKLSSRNSSMFRIKKFANVSNLNKHRKSDSVSDLRKAQKSMPRLDTSLSIFNAGANIKNGVIDLNKTYDIIQQYNQRMQGQSADRNINKLMRKNNQYQNNSMVYPNFVMPSNKNLTVDEKQKWNEIMAFLKQNPGMLLDLMPDGVQFDFPREEKNDFARKGQSMIPDLDVVPPPSDHLEKRSSKGDSVISHTKNQSFGDSKFSSDSYQKRGLFPINKNLNKLGKNDVLLQKPHNTPSDSNKMWVAQFSKKTGKPATANRAAADYQTPSFLTSNIINTVNKTVYKARVAALGSRGQQTSNSNFKDTTILDKKTIIVESETENLADNDSDVTQSQAIQMQNTINLASDSSEASTKKRSKASDNGIDHSDPQTDSKPQEGMKTHKRNKSSKLQSRSISKAETERDRNTSRLTKEKPIDEVLNDDSVIDQSADKPLYITPRRNPSNLEYEKSASKSISDIERSASRDISRNDLSDNNRLHESPTVPNLMRKPTGENIKSNDTTFQEANEDKSISNHRVQSNLGDNVTSLKGVTPRDASSKTLVKDRSRSDIKMFDSKTNINQVEQNYGDNPAETVLNFSRLEKISQKDETISQGKRSSSDIREESKSKISTDNLNESIKKDYRETSYFGNNTFEAVDKDKDEKTQKSLTSNKTYISRPNSDLRPIDNKLIKEEEKHLNRPTSGLFEIESEGLGETLVRHTEPEPEFEDSIEPDGENEDGNLEDDTRTIYYNQTLRSFKKSERSVRYDDKDMRNTPAIKEVEEKEFEDDQERSSEEAKSRQQTKSDLSSREGFIKKRDDLDEPVFEPDVENEIDDSADERNPPRRKSTKFLSKKSVKYEEEKQSESSQAEEEAPTPKYVNPYSIEDKSIRPVTTNKSEFRASNKALGSKEERSKHDSLTEKNSQKDDYKSNNLPNIRDFSKKSVKEKSKVEESKNQSKLNILDGETTEYAPYVEESEKSLYHKSKRSVAISVRPSSTSKISSQPISILSKDEENKSNLRLKNISPYKVKKDAGCSVITHTPTEKEWKQSVG